MRAQHGRYTVLEVGPDAAPPREITVIDKVLLAADEPEQVVDAIADPDTTAVTLTVTEKGYVCRPGSHDLDTTDLAIRRDATLTEPPASAIGLMAAGLLRRLDHCAPLHLVSCDNVGHNGAGLRTVMEQYASLLPSAQSRALLGYLATVGTPDTMVDRIVPRTTDATRAAVARAGIVDAVPVPAEPFSMVGCISSGHRGPWSHRPPHRLRPLRIPRRGLCPVPKPRPGPHLPAGRVRRLPQADPTHTRRRRLARSSRPHP